MTIRLADIGVQVDRGGLGRGAEALLHEVADRLERLSGGGEPEMIDLRSLPLDGYDRERLQRVLGTGEVEATLKLDGTSHIRETSIPGVWWVEHRTERGELIAELLEIAPIPDILSVATDELGRAAAALRARIGAGARPVTPEDAP